jgi:hypothetical protein
LQEFSGDKDCQGKDLMRLWRRGLHPSYFVDGLPIERAGGLLVCANLTHAVGGRARNVLKVTVCVCVCVRERERDRDRLTIGPRRLRDGCTLSWHLSENAFS